MQQRRLRLGDILDDYCPRERRLTNHAVVAMVGEDVKQTRCSTCDAEHEYKHARIPRQRRKPDTPAALYSQVVAGAPKRVQHESRSASEPAPEPSEPAAEPVASAVELQSAAADTEPSERIAESPARVLDAAPAEEILDAAMDASDEPVDAAADIEEGPVHRPLIRATLPRPEGQPPPSRPLPEFTIRQPGGRQNRFRPISRGGLFQRNRGNGNMSGPMRGGAPRPMGAGRPPQGAMTPRVGRRRGRKRSK